MSYYETGSSSFAIRIFLILPFEIADSSGEPGGYDRGAGAGTTLRIMSSEAFYLIRIIHESPAATGDMAVFLSELSAR